MPYPNRTAFASIRLCVFYAVEIRSAQMHTPKKGVVTGMKKNIRSVGCFGIFVLLLGLVLTLTVAAIDTPWIPLSPDSSTQTTEPSVAGNGDTTEPSTREGTSGSDAPAATGRNASQTHTEPKKGCGSTVSGTVLLLSTAFAVWVAKRDQTDRS